MKLITACFISHLSTNSGAERVLLELIDALKEHGVECYVIIPRQGPLIQELESRRVTYWVSPYKMWMDGSPSLLRRTTVTIWNLILAIPLALRIIKWKCNIIITNTSTVCIGALAAKLLALPHVWYIHEFGYEDHGLKFHLGENNCFRLINYLSSICIANSFAVAHKLKRFVKHSKLKVVYCATNVNYASYTGNVVAKRNSGIKCVIVGTLQEGKRQEDAILAIRELVHKRVKAYLSIVGEGGLRKYLQDLVIKNNLEEYIKFIGYKDNPFPFIESSDVLLMCSRCEAFGRVTIEAMKLGKPVIGAKSGGTIELICEGFNGLLYNPMNYKELSEKIEYLYENPHLAKQMGKNGQEWARERFNQTRYGNEFYAILYNLLN